MRGRGSSGGDTKLWLFAAFFIAILTLFLLSSRSTNQDDSVDKPPSVQRRSQSGSSGSQFKLPIYNREGKQVIGRMDYERTQITEMNITSHYTDLNGNPATVSLFVMATTTNPPFAAVIANPHQEAASWDVYANGDMEIPTRKLFEYILKEKCSSGDYLVVDAGANLGYFASYSAVMGCRVIAFEPQPRLLPIIRTSVLVNGLTDRFDLHNNIVNVDKTERLKIVYAAGVCTGCSSVSKAQPGEKNTDNSFIIDAIRIDEVVKEDVLLMKVDVEGYEVLALESASGVFENYNIKNILIEWFPSRFPHSVERGTRMLEKLIDQGYTLRHYDLRFSLPTEWTEQENFPIAGRAWKVSRDNVAKMQEHLLKQSYGEANLWLSKEH